MRDEKVAPPLEVSDALRQRQGPADAASIDDSKAAHYLIPGLTHRGYAFRPSDWAERLSGVVALFVDERAAQTGVQRRQFARPVMHDGIKSLLIDTTLRDACPGAFAFLSSFAIENGLAMHARTLENECVMPYPSPC